MCRSQIIYKIDSNIFDIVNSNNIVIDIFKYKLFIQTNLEYVTHFSIVKDKIQLKNRS
jgi:hypothetical protein